MRRKATSVILARSFNVEVRITLAIHCFDRHVKLSRIIYEVVNGIISYYTAAYRQCACCVTD